MSSLAIRILPEPVRSISGATIGAGYMGIGTALANPIRLIHLQNLTDALLMFSLNGIDDHFPLPPNGFLLLDIASNKSQSHGLYISQGTRFYVKEIGTPTTGSVYLSVWYGTDTGH